MTLNIGLEQAALPPTGVEKDSDPISSEVSVFFEGLTAKTEVSTQSIMEWQKLMLNETLQLQTRVSGTNKISSSLEQLLRGQ